MAAPFSQEFTSRLSRVWQNTQQNFFFSQTMYQLWIELNSISSLEKKNPGIARGHLCQECMQMRKKTWCDEVVTIIKQRQNQVVVSSLLTLCLYPVYHTAILGDITIKAATFIEGCYASDNVLQKALATI